jgi:prophage antirepressor-like protein
MVSLMSTVKLFVHPQLGILTTYTDENGNEYFKAHDVCVVLSLTNPSAQLKRNVKDKWVFEFDDGYSKSGKALYVSEPGLYALVFRSKTHKAKAFQDWVFEVVLPKLRASGGYIMPTATSKQLEALQSEITNMKAQKQALFSPIGGYDLDGFWQLMMNHGVVYSKDSSGSRGIYKRIVNILNRIDAEKPELVICQRIGRHNFKSIFARCLFLSTETWISVIKEAGVMPDRYPKFFKLFE